MVGLLCVLGAANAAVPVAWQAVFGGNGEDTLTTAVNAPDGGFLLGGYSTSPPSGNKTAPGGNGERYWVVKVDAGGNRQWDRSYGDASGQLYAMQPIPGGGYLLGGQKYVMGMEKDYHVLAINPNGDPLWERFYGGTLGDYLVAVVGTADGGCLLGGYSRSDPGGQKTAPMRGSADYWVVKIDANGSQLWDRSYGGDSYEEFTCMLALPDGGALLGGVSSSGLSGNKTVPSLGGGDVWVVRIDAQGNRLWDRAYGGSGDDSLFAAVAAPDNGFLLAGTSSSPVSGNKTAPNLGSFDMWVVRVDADGNKLWDRAYGGSGSEYPTAGLSTPGGGFLLVGRSWSPSGGQKTSPHYGGGDGWVVSIDGQGALRWEQSFGSTDYDSFQAILRAPGVGYLLAGWSVSLGVSGNKTAPGFGSSDYWVVQISSSVLPIIEQQPRSLVATGGTTVSFSVAVASFTQPVIYQWRFSGTDLAGATNATLTLTNVQPSQAGPYTVLVRNDIGAVESEPAILTYTDAADLVLSLRPAITVYGTIGRTYSIEFSDILARPPQWSFLGQITLTNTPQVFVDTQAMQGERFYRVVLAR
jgi:hypothetical protein